MVQSAKPVKQEVPPPSTWWMTLPASIILLGGMALATGPLLHLDQSREGMLLTYPSRYLCLALTIATSAVLAACGCRKRFWIALACCCLLGVQFGWGPASLGAAVDNTTGFTMLALNVNNETAHTETLAEICRQETVDFLLLQQVHVENCDTLEADLSEYRFFRADGKQNPENAELNPYCCLTGIHKSLITTDEIPIETAITGHRTFALKLKIQNGLSHLPDIGLWLINVHTAEPFSTSDNIFTSRQQVTDKCTQHVEERAQLELWLAHHRNEPVVLGGDFNAPWNSHNLRINGLDNAHLATGSGPHLTFPRKYPIWGRDHILATTPIDFLSYRIFDTGFSNHRAQIGRFRIHSLQRKQTITSVDDVADSQ